MTPEEVLQEILENRAAIYVAVCDRLGRPEFRDRGKTPGRSFHKKDEIKSRFDWRWHVAGAYAPLTGLEFHEISPHGQIKKPNFTCDTARDLYNKTTYISDYEDCHTPREFMTVWDGSPAVGALIKKYIDWDAISFGTAFDNAIGHKIWKWDSVPFIHGNYSQGWLTYPELKVNLKFPLPKKLTFQKLVSHIEVIQ